MKMKNKFLLRKVALALAAWSSMACATFAADGKGKASDSAFAPTITSGSTLALGVNFSRQQLFKIADSILGHLLKMPEADKKSINELRQKIEACKRDPWADAPQDVLDFLKECGLRDVYPRWAVLSLDGPLPIDSENLNLERMALAIAADVDLEKLISAVSKKMAADDDDSVSFQKILVGGEKAWQIVPKDGDIVRGMSAVNANPHLASLDGKLLLLALSRTTLEEQIRLYRKGLGKGKDDALGGFAAADGELLRFHVSGIGNMIKDVAPLDAWCGTKQGDLAAEITSIAKKIVMGLQALSADIKTTQGGAVGLTLCLEAASEDDAEVIRTLTGAVLVIAKTCAARSSDVPKEIAAALKSIHIGGLENKIELRCADVMPMLEGSLFPAVFSAKQNANTSAMAMKGRNLFVGIVQANTEREAAGLAAAWPRTTAVDGTDKDDIAGKAYQKSTDYFRDLFDMANHGKAEWDPYVACGMDVVGKDFDEWCVVANVTDDMPDCIPVLISANFNPELLLSKWDGNSDSTTPLPIGPEHGATKSLFDDKVIIVVRKGGASQVIKAKYLTYKNLYGDQTFDLTNAKTPVVYLTPKGIAQPGARK